ncbi:2,3,4,5-tetrahydropyridine-2,6-dicarboxylate N-acetyltransferase [Amylolactobacillus amylotrophicus DSM 20534]|uniref:2,3,4,5-tetrahydropyridine-2,6-dicarboxylate N-acetyltransferase n=4 Tax=Amylolactobacillus TaxID=2767876 RepID=A0A0R1YKS5_9LACO|nr:MULTISPECIES: 2,3,4,5-tetrahydropyridine-2,6-dicarboxylate N-acetyltransferase [Amylolactobacillus]APT18437.1 2,3,4,5-tetrahydropyridine-2,6-dicarboxylate N-acetyltransferase [Amylolactobacillus amylophilus DSM 20533 = JCM 1125]KRK38224.1 2,3,4,5-tetrahydropyridine-2,6-dicarboxylate N-acetyltransferase [Amylolactobacillus amylotrophicus DSM 20534]KRM43134.1 2,3,4,5-tetrahydropyridine-2,6-dicarboxylate N-acetyltransferase [Amylolactobacillus amylophilus DSM 20533 = JCM 1125]GED80466.1 2,3,4,5
MSEFSAQEIINFIANGKKQTPVKVYIGGQLADLVIPESIQAFIEQKTGILFGEYEDISKFMRENQAFITSSRIESAARNSAVPLLDTTEIPARIEPGAIIRDRVEIGQNAVIMMGAIINIGAIIGTNTMIDMGAVLGGRATVGANCHIGAGAVLAGVIEPASATPVIIEDDVLVGANAVVIEGVRVGTGAVIAAGAVVIDDVAPHTVVAGSPARKIKDVDAKTISKTGLQAALRKL